MNSSGYFTTIFWAALVTYATRFPAVLLGRSLTLPHRLARGLKYIPMGVFAAILAPSIILHRSVHGQLDYATWIASAAAFIAAWRTKNPLWTMLVGVATMAILRIF